MPKNIFLYGYYGAGNFGDELLLYKIISDIQSVIDDDLTFYVWTTNPEYTEKFLKQSIESIQLICVSRFDLKATITAIKESEIIVLGGGGIIQEYYGIQIEDLFKEFGKHIPSYSIPLLIGKMFGKKTFLWTIGHGPIGTYEATAFSRWFYSMADCITTRDQESYQQINLLLEKKDNIYCDIDPILDTEFNLENLIDKKTTKSGKNIGISVRNWFNNDQIIDSFSKAIYQFKQKNPHYTINLIVADKNLDTDILNQIKTKSAVEDINLLEPQNPFDTIKHIYSQDYLISMRLHTTIVGYRLGIPMVAISYDKKTDNYIKYFNIDSIDIYNLSSQLVLYKLNNLISNKHTSTPINLTYSTPKIFKDFVNQHNAQTTLAINTIDIDDRLLKSLFKRNKTLQETVENLTIQNNQLNQENKTLQETVENLTIQNNQLNQENKTLQETVENLTIQNNQLNQEYIQLSNKLHQLDIENSYYKKSLEMIYSSDFWKLAQKYYKIRDKNKVLKNIHSFLKYIKRKLTNKEFSIQQNTDQTITNTKDPQSIKSIIEKDNKVAVIISGIKFDETLNQRPLNLAKEFSKAGYTVFFVIFQWSPQDYIENSYQEVYKNIFQVPMYDFMDILKSIDSNLNINKSSNRKVIITFPHKNFIDIYNRLRQLGFRVIYDIMDDWQAFYEVGQASWYDADIEEKIILESDIVIAVNDFIKQKFNNLRLDIHTVPNGYSVEVVGKEKKFIGASNTEKGKIRIGYVGWLTENLFNWPFVLELSKIKDNIIIELIGYDIPERIKENLPKNIVYIGKVHPKELYKYFSNWNGVLIPFIDHHISKGADPIKIYQYIYYGLPVLCTGMEHLSSYPLVYNVSDISQAYDFIDMISDKNSIEELRNKNIKNIEKFLEESLWSNRFKIIIKDEKKSLWELG